MEFHVVEFGNDWTGEHTHRRITYIVLQRPAMRWRLVRTPPAVEMSVEGLIEHE